MITRLLSFFVLLALLMTLRTSTYKDVTESLADLGFRPKMPPMSFKTANQ